MIPRNTMRRQTPGGRQHGFTLVEMLLALVIGLFLLAVTFAGYTGLRTSNAAQSGLVQLHDRQRMLLALVTTTLQQAGYFVSPQTMTVSAALPAGNVVWRDGSAAALQAGQVVTGAGSGAGSDQVAVQYQTASGDGAINCVGGINNSGVNQLWINAYWVDASNRLVCSLNGATAVPLVSGVASLTILYGVDTDGDGSNDCYLPADAVSAAALWKKVHTVRLTVLLQDPTATATGTVLPTPLVQYVDLKNVP